MSTSEGGAEDTGVLEADHPYVIALDLGFYADPSQPKEGDDADLTFAVQAAAMEAT